MVLALKASSKTAADNILFFFFFFLQKNSEKTKLDISCESSDSLEMSSVNLSRKKSSAATVNGAFTG